MERAHVVQPVGELHQQHADVVDIARAGTCADSRRRARSRDCASILLSLVTPSTSRATSLPNSFSISSGVASVSSIVSWRIAVTIVSSSSLRSVRMPGDLDRVAEIGIARGAHLRAVRLHREDVGAVDQRLVRVGIVGPDLLDQFVLPEHAPKMGRGGALVQARKERVGPRRGKRGPAGDLTGRRARRSAAPWRTHCSDQARRGQRMAVDDEAVEPPGTLGQRLAKHQRAAFVGRALAGGGAAIPDDVAGNEPAGSRDGRIGRIAGRGGRSGG